jgi:DNA polymerase-3 subunit delta
MPSAYPNQLDATLRQSTPAVLLLWGDDAGAIRQAAQAAIAASGIDVDDPFSAEKLSLTDLLAQPSRLAESAGTLTFGGGRRLIHLTGVGGEESAANIATLTEAVKGLLEQPDLSGALVVLPIPHLLEKTSAIVKAIEGHPNGLSVRFFLPTARDLAQWLQGAFSTAGKRPDGDAMALLTDSLGADREQAQREVEKLLLYVGENQTITAEDVRASLSGAVPADAFRLAEAVASRDVRSTDRLIRLLTEEGEDLSAAFSLTINHLAKLRTAQALKQQGKTDEELLQAAGKFKAPPSAKAVYLQQVKAYPAGRLATLPAYALETLAAARSGTLDGHLTLSRALLALAT